MLPGKGTGFVVVCEGRKCFSEFRGQFTPLGLLPTNLSPEDRKGVVKWALFEMHYLTQLSFRHAVSGEPLPDPFKGGD
ncbi:MAG: hypothetical protein EBT15_07305 [Betaproteobacteria bacterium]|nr:hypothetical protein [Betaproteobacteria bacterium]